MSANTNLLFGFILIFYLAGLAKKSGPYNTVNLKINREKVELVDSMVKISALKNEKLELECDGKPVTINKHKIVYSSNDLDKVAE